MLTKKEANKTNEEHKEKNTNEKDKISKFMNKYGENRQYKHFLGPFAPSIFQLPLYYMALPRFSTVMVDTYALARMLKALYNYSNTSIIIVYAGFYHTNFYIEALNKLVDMTKIEEIRASDNIEYTSACIDIDTGIYYNKWNTIMKTLEDTFKDPKKCKMHPKL